MSNLYQRYFLKCPYSRAKAYLEESVQAYARAGTPNIMALRVPIHVANSGGTALEKEVVVTYETGTDPMHFDQPWKIRWSPRGGGPYPSFDGTITVRADTDYSASILELQGVYEPPFGTPGAAFDAVIGSRLASATARELLGQIGSKMEMRYRDEEHAKQVHSS